MSEPNPRGVQKILGGQSSPELPDRSISSHLRPREAADGRRAGRRHIGARRLRESSVQEVFLVCPELALAPVGRVVRTSPPSCWFSHLEWAQVTHIQQVVEVVLS